MPKILIVDDEPFNIDYLEQELEDSDYQIVTAINGKDALDKVRTEHPDLILLDIMMPVMDGFEVLSRIKAEESTRQIPVIVISANDNLQSVVKGIELGAEDYLPKPFEPTLLHARIFSSLERKRYRDLEQMYLKSMERELDIAREIQQGFLPAALPDVNGWKISTWFKAAKEVAGDFYDVFQLHNGKLLFVVGDVCGKGVGAALFMTLFRSLIRVVSTGNDLFGIGGEKELKDKDHLLHVISFTNQYIARTHGDANMFATLFVGLIDPKTGALVYVNCGNEAALQVKSSGEFLSLPPSGPAVGVIPEAQFVVQKTIMAKSDILIAFTDGIPDAVNEEGQPFGKEWARDLMARGEDGPEQIVKRIERELSGFIGKAEQFDDITLLVIQRTE